MIATKIHARGQGIVAGIKTVVVGRKFLYGEIDFALSGFTTRVGAGEFVQVWRDGDCYHVEDHGSSWRLWLVAGAEFDTHIIGGEPLTIPKQQEVGA